MSVCLCEKGAQIEISTKEERVIALSACRHYAHAELCGSWAPPCL